MKKINLFYKVTSAMVALLLMTVLLATVEPVMAIEEPDFTVIDTRGGVEFRKYEPFILAETLIKNANSRSSANNAGFRRLFKYISGENTQQEKIEMTAPVIQSGEIAKGEKIEMTAPVQQSETEDGFLVAFVLPFHFTMDTAPIPDDPTISLRLTESRMMAVKSFSGRWTENNFKKYENQLMTELEQVNMKIIGEVEFAAYNAPFTLPFMRRNEVMVEINNVD
jgi:hypothetical protein